MYQNTYSPRATRVGGMKAMAYPRPIYSREHVTLKVCFLVTNYCGLEGVKVIKNFY